jgi:hypothetical protein
VCGLSYSILHWINLNQNRLVDLCCEQKLWTSVVDKTDIGIRNDQASKLGMQMRWHTWSVCHLLPSGGQTCFVKTSNIIQQGIHVWTAYDKHM